MSRCARLILAISLVLAMTEAVRGETPPAESDKEHTDRYGDPLPPGALARLGTVRWRHGGPIHELAFSPDGKMVAFAGQGGTVSLWDFASGKELHRLTTPELDISTLAFSPSGKLLAFASFGGKTIYLHEAASGKQLRKIAEKVNGVYALAFSSDGKILAWGDLDGVVRLWDVAAARERRPVKGLGESINSLVFTPDGKSLLLGRMEGEPPMKGTILHVDLATGKELRRFRVCAGGAKLTALAADGRSLASAAEDGTLRIWELATGKEARRIGKWDGELHALFFTPNGKSLIAAGWQEGSRVGMVKLWDTATGRELRSLQGLNAAVSAAACSPDGKVLGVAGWDNCVRFFDIVTGVERPHDDGHKAPIASVALCLDGRVAATAAGDGSVRFWDAATGKQRQKLEGHSGRGYGLSAFPDGKKLVLMGGSPTIRLWDAAAGKELRRTRGPGQFVWSVGFPSGGDTLAVDVAKNRVRLWDGNTGEVRQVIERHQGEFSEGIVSPDGRTLVTSDWTDSLDVWNLKTGKVRFQLASEWGFALSANGKTIATKVKDKGVRLWEVATGRECGRLLGKQEDIWCLAFSPDGRRLASGGLSGAVCLWDTRTGEQLYRSPGHRGTVMALAFSTDGRRLISGSDDTTALVWDIERLVREEGPNRVMKERQLKVLWSDLASEDAHRAYQAIHALRLAGPQSVRWLGRRLKPAETPKDREQVAGLIADLDSDSYAVREGATHRLEKLGSWVEPHLRAKIKAHPSLEVRRRMEALLHRLADQEVHGPEGEILRTWRAVEVLEHIGTAEARDLLEMLAKGAGDARLTQEAKASLARCRNRRP